MSECKFKVGETYKTRNGGKAKVVAIVPEANVENRIVTLVGDEVIVFCENGHYYDGGALSPLDLMPNKRTVWANFYDGGEAYYYASENDANDWVLPRRTRIGNRAYPVEIEE